MGRNLSTFARQKKRVNETKDIKNPLKKKKKKYLYRSSNLYFVSSWIYLSKQALKQNLWTGKK